MCHDVRMTENTPQDWRVRWANKQDSAPSTPLAPPTEYVAPTPVDPTPVDADPFGDERDDEDYDDEE